MKELNPLFKKTTGESLGRQSWGLISQPGEEEFYERLGVLNFNR